MMNTTALKCLFLEVHWQLTPQYITVSVMSCVISSIFALTSVLGNGTIMFAIWKENFKDLHSPAFTLLFCLAVADVLVDLISQPSFVAFKTAELLRQYNVCCNLRLIQFFSGWIIGSVSFLKAGFHMIANDRRRSRIADDRKETSFHIIADDRKRSQSRL